MTSQRSLLGFLAAVFGLLLISGILTGVFFLLVPGDDDSPEWEAGVIAPIAEPARPRPGSDTPGPGRAATALRRVAPPDFVVGESGRERKFGYKLPATARREAPAGEAEDQAGRTAGAIDALGEIPLIFEEECAEYGGPFDFTARGAGFEIFLGPGQVCLSKGLW